MYYGKYQGKHHGRRHRNKCKTKIVTLILSLMILIAGVVTGTIAYLATNSNEVENEFTPANVSCEVEEDFNGIYKENITATNTSDIRVYIRVKLVTYRVSADDPSLRIGGTAEIGSFTPGTGWEYYEADDCYYYIYPVYPNETISSYLVESIKLKEYTDADGGVQVIEVMAEAIQADGGSIIDDAFVPAVQQVWPVKVNSDGTLSLNSQEVQE